MSIKGLTIGKTTFESRLILGTGKFSSIEMMIEAVKASHTELVTVALRRFNLDNREDDLYKPLSELDNVSLMPNTSGAQTAEEAVKVAQLGREISGSSIVKLEIHPNPHHLLPDPIETFKAAEVLAKDGFDVLPYIPPDPVLCKRLEDAGCSAVMPLGSPIGTGKGIEASGMLSLIIKDSNIPVIVDAGLRSPAEAATAIEMGCDAVLVNSAIAAAGNPSEMACAFAMAVEAGTKAREAGLMAISAEASPTSPLTSFLSESES